MLNKEQMDQFLAQLSNKLKTKGLKGEIGIVGGAAMLLAYDARKATKDIDAIFEPATSIRTAIIEIANENNLTNDWLNDAVKGFMPANPPTKNIYLETPNLVVWIPEPAYLLAMKAISARFDTLDRKDLQFLIKKLNLKNPEEVFNILVAYYPTAQIPPKTQFLIEELFAETC